MGVPENIFHKEIFRISRKNEVLDIDETDYIVLLLLVHGKTGIHGFPEYIHHLVIGSVYVDSNHIDPRDHDILCQGIGKIKHIIDHFPLFGFDDAVLMTYLHIGAKLGLGHGSHALAWIDMHQPQDSVRQLVDYENHRGQELHQPIYDAAVRQGKLFRGNHGPGFGDDFAEDQNDNGQSPGSNAYRKVDARCQGSSQGSGREIYDIVADQYGTEHFAVIFQYFIDPCGALAAFLLQSAHTHAVDSGEGCFRRREKTG